MIKSVIIQYDWTVGRYSGTGDMKINILSDETDEEIFERAQRIALSVLSKSMGMPEDHIRVENIRAKRRKRKHRAD